MTTSFASAAPVSQALSFAEETPAPYRPLRLRSTREMSADQVVWVKPVGAPDSDVQEATVLKCARDCLVAAVHGATPMGSLPYDEEDVDVQFARYDDACYRFRTRVMKIAQTLDGVVCLAHSDRLLRRQARQYVRVSMEGHARFAPTTEHRLLARMLTGRSAPRREQCVGRLVDLSGGGCAVRTRIATPDTEFMLLWFDLFPGEPLVEAPAEVAGAEEVGANDAPQNLIHLRFRHIAESVRQTIIQYVFDRQLHAPSR